ncbi:hypothetical protein QFC20_003775 [Naganishia adeliensis]|uniref:Uncharacterized protein n=1 Tax=Naganishia adeliensis TaxID=92952 RepID=A0ACC2W7F9_9TREE|nr:hypothetical protein QFC20_003775 [Naganishia adeliensis]
MDSPAPTSKRKRSGKAREEAKARAIAAAEQAKLEPEQTEDGMDVDAELREDGEGGEDAEGERREKRKRRSGSLISTYCANESYPQGLKSLHPILKRSKTSETQRIIKKIKFLRSKGEGEHTSELAELESQLDALKKLDLHSTIPPLLNLKLRKHPSLRPLLPLPDDLFADASTTPVDPTTPQGKVQNRILSSKGTGEAVNGVVGWCIGLEGGKLKTGKGKGKVDLKKEKEMQSTSSRKEKPARDESKQPRTTNTIRKDEEDDDLVAQDAAADAAGWESGSVGSDDEDDCVADEDSDSNHGLGSDSDEDDKPAVKRPRTLESSFSPPPAKNSKKADGSGSLFLPTLASGFTMGSYDSDPDEDEKRDKKSGKGGLIQSVRKNRRGQAERRKIWEQKYGKGANHVKKQQVETERTEQDAKFLTSQMGGAAAKPKWGQRGTDKPSGGAVRDAGWQRAAPKPTAAAPAAAAKPPPKPATTVTGTEHPSWIAAKLRKEREMAVPAAKPKKIVFD